ncbi:MAG: HAMP domain-containing histidine kinase, partial [Oscillospiraceae bacterium]|nr:HAMP domain-containing histidine kinase [Oscillospiraceae bacterium]
MRDGLFKQYFFIFMVTLLTCTALLGLALLTFTGVNYTSQRQQLLAGIVDNAVSIMEKAWTPRGFQEDSLSSLGGHLGDTSDISIYITDVAGTVQMCTEDECHHGTKAPEHAVDQIRKDGSYFSAGYFSGLFRNRGDYVYGAAMRSGGTIVGYLFATTPVGPLFAYLYETLFSYLFSAGVMMLGAFVVIYTTTLRLTAPLQEMSKAAESFGRGDFSARINVTGNDEIAVLAASFNKMAESLDEFEQNRRSFVANVSHDLRTPMTTIGGYIDGILDGTIPKEEENRYLEIVSGEVKRLSRLTSSLISAMRVEEQKQDLNLVSVDAWELILNIMFNLEGRIEEKKLYVPDFETEELYVSADKDMLHQVVYNLIDNAVKYTPVGGELLVTAQKDGKYALISVQNSGNGIAPEEQPFIFERFYKTDKSRGLDRNGTGLGLYIVKMLTTGMGGDVTVESDGESYTKFTVKLLQAAAPVDKTQKEQPHREKRNKEKQPKENTRSFRMPWNRKSDDRTQE